MYFLLYYIELLITYCAKGSPQVFSFSAFTAIMTVVAAAVATGRVH
jgi:hypothetical protein